MFLFTGGGSGGRGGEGGGGGGLLLRWLWLLLCFLSSGDELEAARHLVLAGPGGGSRARFRWICVVSSKVVQIRHAP